MSSRKRDALIFEKIFECEIHWDPSSQPEEPVIPILGFAPVQEYSINMDLAQEVLNELRGAISIHGSSWIVHFEEIIKPFVLTNLEMPEAACLAALRAKGVEI